MVGITSPPLPHRWAPAIKARAVELEMVPERPFQESLRAFPRDCRVFEIEFELSRNVVKIHKIEQASLFAHFLVESSSRRCRAQPDLMEIRFVIYRVHHLILNVTVSVMLRPDNG